MKRLNGTKGQRARKVPALNQEIGKPEVSLAKNNHNGRYRQWLDSLMGGCQIIDFDWRYLHADGTAIKHSRCSKEGSLGHTVMEAHPGIVLTQDGKLDFVNARFRETMGYSSEKELISRPSLELIHPDDRETTREYCLNRLRGKKAPSTCAVRAIDREGNTK